LVHKRDLSAERLLSRDKGVPDVIVIGHDTGLIGVFRHDLRDDDTRLGLVGGDGVHQDFQSILFLAVGPILRRITSGLSAASQTRMSAIRKLAAWPIGFHDVG
jgi:hypothetical protein